MIEKNNAGFESVEMFHRYRRNLPHWEQPGSVYFITFRTAKNFVLSDELKDIIFQNIQFYSNKKYKLYSCVVMHDHAHVILQPLEKTRVLFIVFPKSCTVLKDMRLRK